MNEELPGCENRVRRGEIDRLAVASRDLALRHARAQRRQLAFIICAIGFPIALWFNHSVMPTDGPGPIGFATAVLLIMVLVPKAARGKSSR